MTEPTNVPAGANENVNNQEIPIPGESPVESFMAPGRAPYAQQHGSATTAPFVKMVDDWVKRHPDSPFPELPTIVFQPIPPTNVELILEKAKDGIPIAINSGLVYFGTRTTVKSAIGFLNTKDQTAKTLYALGVIIGTTSVFYSTQAVGSGTCCVDTKALLSELIAEACFKGAQEADQLAKEQAREADQLAKEQQGLLPKFYGWIAGRKARGSINRNTTEMLSLSGGALELDEVTSSKDPVFVKSINGSETIGVKVSTKESNSELKPQIQEGFSDEKTKFQRFREKAAFTGYLLLGILGITGVGNGSVAQRGKIGTTSPQDIMRSYEEMYSQQMGTTSKQFDAEIIMVDGVTIVKDDTIKHSKTDSSLTDKMQGAQLGEDAEATEKSSSSSTDENKSTPTSKGKLNKKRRAPRKYGKVMRLSDLPPLENDRFDLSEFDKYLTEGGTYRPSERKIAVRLPYSNTIIVPRNN